MNTRTDLNLTLYENLLKIDEKIKEYFQVSISPIVSASFKRGVLENFNDIHFTNGIGLHEQRLKIAELESDKFTNYIDIIKDNYRNIINNNISHIEKKIKTIDDNYELNNDIER